MIRDDLYILIFMFVFLLLILGKSSRGFRGSGGVNGPPSKNSKGPPPPPPPPPPERLIKEGEIPRGRGTPL